MRLSLKGKNLDITPGLTRLVTARLAKLERRFKDALVSSQCVLAAEKNRYVVELTVHARQDHILHGVGSTRCVGHVGDAGRPEGRAAGRQGEGQVAGPQTLGGIGQDAATGCTGARDAGAPSRLR